MDERQRKRVDLAKLRARSEAELADRATRVPEMTREAMIELVHELDVHQVELSIQNAELLDTQEELRVTRERYYDLYHLAPVAYLTIDGQGRVTEANRVAEELFGGGRSLVGLPFHSFVAREDQDDLYRHRTALASSGEKQVVELRLEAPKGRRRWCALESTPVAGPSDQDPVCRVVVTDVSLHRKAEQSLAAARDAADAQSQAKSEFLANMSHEIRTPMNGVLGILELLQGSSLSPDQNELVTDALSAARSLLQVVNDILDFSRIEAGNLLIDPRPFDHGKIFRQFERSLTHLAAEKGLLLEFDMSPEIPNRLIADEGRIRQVLINLIGNAIKFTPSGRVRVSAEREAAPADRDRIRYRVQDSGPGIPPEQRASIFQRFIQAEGPEGHRRSGTGLGLAICSQLVALMGGEIGISDGMAGGSEFWFTLPVVPAMDGSARVPDPSPAIDTSAALANPPSARLRVLVVEDNVINQKVLKRLLERENVEVRTAADGAEALVALEAGSADMIFMDVQMPVMDGFEATRLIRQREGQGPRATIIGLTAHALQSYRDRCLSAGMDDFLPKPIESAKVISLIREIREGRFRTKRIDG